MRNKGSVRGKDLTEDRERRNTSRRSPRPPSPSSKVREKRSFPGAPQSSGDGVTTASYKGSNKSNPPEKGQVGPPPAQGRDATVPARCPSSGPPRSPAGKKGGPDHTDNESRTVEGKRTGGCTHRLVSHIGPRIASAPEVLLYSAGQNNRGEGAGRVPGSRKKRPVPAGSAPWNIAFPAAGCWFSS